MRPAEYLIPKGKHLPVQEGDFIEKGEYILDGHPAPHDILARQGRRELGDLPGQRSAGGVPPAGCEASTTSTSK